jgi:tetratricopeptide (TPR) repeat protein
VRRLALAAIAVIACTSCRQAAVDRPRPNVLLITIDTFRADRLGVGVAPALDRLAESSIRFTAARTAVPLTLPSHATILTGLLPPAHGVRENGVDQLGASHPTVAALLKTAGYETAAFVGAFVLDRRFGLARGFDVYDDRIPRDPAAMESLEAERSASVVIDRALAWLKTKDAAGSLPDLSAPPSRFFVWIHLYDPHAPYTPPPEFGRRAPTPYDGEIAYADAQIARVFDWLHARGQTDRTLVIVAGDHGEGLGYHGERTHGMLLYDSTLRVPLIVAAPGERPARRDEAVSLVDIAPTILHAVGLTPPAEMQGHDLLRGIPNTNLYSETEYPRVAGWSPLAALTDGRWKVIRAGGASEVYDLADDPQEQRDLAASQANIVEAMSARITAIRNGGGTAAPRSISPDAEQRLRSLGYVASTAPQAVDANAPNPAARVADWNTFEDALSALNGHRAGALPALEALAKRNPGALVFQATYARAQKEAGHVDRALAAYREAARRWPTDATLLHDLAVAARDAAARTDGAPAARLREEAARAEQAAITLAPASAAAHNGLGLIAVDENRPRDAVDAFQRAADLDPNNAGYWANLGNARRALGDRTGAEHAYRRALEADPRGADAANGLGVLLVEAQRPSEAIPWLERATAAAPDFVEARLNLGIALQQAGQTARAAETYRSVLSAPPKFKRERDAAAKLLSSLGGR